MPAEARYVALAGLEAVEHFAVWALGPRTLRLAVS
jgi:hypothetical protein